MEIRLLDRVYTLINGIIHPHEVTTPSPSEIKTPLGRRCPVTHLNIDMQPKNSKFLSSIGVHWYFENRYRTYKDTLLPYLSEHWKGRPVEEQFREIAHNIRNQDSNPRNNTKRKITRILQDKNSLFDPVSLIDRKKLEEVGLKEMLK